MSTTRTELATELGSELNALLVASRTVMAASAARFHPDLQPAAYQLAAMLASQGPTKAGGLADRLGMDKSAVSRLAKSLCDNGLAQASTDSDDGRAIVYSLTDAGHNGIQATNAVKSDAFFSRVEGWSDAEFTLFIGLLRKFNRI
ncbi:winged helix-turn-helix transcriptional regulator [Roseomonas aerophila]|uniref:Winged helix-turn-helix transcriptional regulator n=1 Tax=Teichococcus aerophilus TaxID=1224513 RepID=A0ABR7RS39_9PROT|nr:MarR family winged helix-turn-helix transcriptional regulator [Pseudoroseomonas aerophila]MBC9208960.1 winged helix-turn-helix transcriptional regulator [Pseudoroseomonas aerophila]